MPHFYSKFVVLFKYKIKNRKGFSKNALLGFGVKQTR